MKKTLKYTLYSAAFALCGMTTGCDTLDIDNLTSYDESMVWSNPDLSTAFVNQLYADNFGNWSAGADNNADIVTGMPWYIGTITETGGSYKNWTYTNVRAINEAIHFLSQSTALDEATKKTLLGECYFLRAYRYYWMVIHHGGVPYITVPQDQNDDLKVSRNSTKECFDLMIKDLDAAIAALPDKIAGTSNNYGRIDKTFALAWKAKTLLLKASPQFNPNNMYDNAYYAEAYTAAKTAYDHAIANGGGLEPEYSNIWYNEGGPEVIFPVINSNPNKNCYWDANVRPASVSRSTNYSNPTWEFVRSFPMLDGKAYNDPTGKYYVGTEEDLMQSFWKNRDPRFEDCVIYNGKEYPVAGKVAGYRQYNALGLVDRDDMYGTNPAANTNCTNIDSYSGFYIGKALQLELTQADVYLNDVDYLLMRLPELMFILAEAATETGHEDVAIDMLTQIRKRAGIEAGADGLYGLKVDTRADLREAILLERSIELCYEGHRFWDMRRTRTMMRMNGLIKHGLEAIAINPDGSDMPLNEARPKIQANELTVADFRYVPHQVPFTEAAEKEFVLNESFYFFPIQKSRIQENEKIEQNNNWGGTFNPTME